MEQSYTPSDTILRKYAELLVSAGMHYNNDKPLRKGAVVRFVVPEVAKPLYYFLQQVILEKGFMPIGVLEVSNTDKYKFDVNYYENASNKQLDFYAKNYAEGLIKDIDGNIFIIAESDPLSLQNIESTKVLRRTKAQRAFKEMYYSKADQGKLAWTLGLYGTDAAAEQAGISLKQYWNQIIKACRLDKEDPVKEWRHMFKDIRNTAAKLNSLNIDSVQVSSDDMEINIGIGKNRKWIGGTSNNIPSFEIFTSPDYRRVNGWVKFNNPHFRYGKKIEGIELEFKNGKVIKSSATKNYDLLQAMLKTKGGDYIGEFSLTDSRFSNITKFMAEILYDENAGGKYGNTHIALGNAYRDCFKLNSSNYSEDKWDELGFNKSVVHSDLISTTNRTVTATLSDGSEKVIYQNGQFTI